MNAISPSSRGCANVTTTPIVHALGTVSVRDIVDHVLPTLLQQQMRREEKEHFLGCLRKQLFEPLETLFRATAVARVRPLEGTQITAGPADNLADRYGIRDRGVLLRTEGSRTYVLKIFQHRGAWALFVCLFDEQALAEEELQRAFQPVHQPRGDHRNGRRAA